VIFSTLSLTIHKLLCALRRKNGFGLATSQAKYAVLLTLLGHW
jgi:hypothetical protein